MSTTTHRFTADQLLKMPEDGFRYELVKGELRKMSPSGFEHGKVVARFTLALGQYVEANDLGVVVGAETGFILEHDPDTVLAPDVGFVRKDRLPAGPVPDTFWDGPPDFAVEVLSPGDRPGKVSEKIEAWLKTGVRALWAADCKQRTVKVYRPGAEPRTLNEQDFLDGEDVVPGFRHKVADIFA